jgi:hypothetical protein
VNEITKHFQPIGLYTPCGSYPESSDEKDLTGHLSREKCKALDAGNHAVVVEAEQRSNFPREMDLSNLCHQKTLDLTAVLNITAFLYLIFRYRLA